MFSSADLLFYAHWQFSRPCPCSGCIFREKINDDKTVKSQFPLEAFQHSDGVKKIHKSVVPGYRIPLVSQWEQGMGPWALVGQKHWRGERFTDDIMLIHASPLWGR